MISSFEKLSTSSLSNFLPVTQAIKRQLASGIDFLFTVLAEIEDNLA
ncbi:MAG: hypothetical protein HC910_00505 [Spirulinaceae cyanobacterium SM2_1_0]|nr:hypothetical protein [Spirulinaceae cyanobacterium SM2_1_0]